MSFIPLSELQGERVNLALPEYVPQEQIGINVDRLDALARLGGFAAGVALTSFAGQTTEVQHTIVGHDGRGNAYAGASAVRRVHASEEEFGSSPFLIHGHPPLSIRINTPEVMQRIANANGRLRDPGVWAHELNNAITGSVRRASWNHYVRDVKHPEVAAILLDQAASPNMTPTGITTTFVFNNVVRGIWGVMGRARPSEVCWSLFPGIHPDRALLVAGLSRALKVVKKVGA